jgi:hypothetical protein
VKTRAGLAICTARRAHAPQSAICNPCATACS